MILGSSTTLTIDDIEKVAYGYETVRLDPDVRARVDACARFVREQAESGKVVYGVTTGFGANRDKVIQPADAQILQEKLIMSHACGVGPPLSEPVVRAMMLLRINALAQGNSGVRSQTLELLLHMLNERLHPVVPEMGSVGASGDLCPLAHMCLPLLGQGEVAYMGEVLPAMEGLKRIGSAPIRLTYKEGLALLNGTQAMTALGSVVAARFFRILDCAEIIGAMSLEAVAGRMEAYDDRIHVLRGRDGQRTSARMVRTFLQGSELAGAAPDTIEGKVEYIQDSYCLRCLPQVHGACRDVLAHVRGVLEVEANAVTDNPLVFPPRDAEEGAILSGGNFHGQPVAMALDYMKIAIAELGNISERRSAKLTDKYFSEGLPPFLVSNPGLNSGMMIPQYVAAALVSENKSRASPASVDSIPTSANMEDHVSMGMHAGLHALRMVEHLETILGIEYLIAGQALDLRPEKFRRAAATSSALALLREKVEFMHEDRVLSVDIQHAARLVANGSLAAIAASYAS